YRPCRPAYVQDRREDALVAELAGHHVARVAAEAAAVDHDVVRGAKPRLEERVGPVEILLGQADRARDVAHLPEVHGAGVQEERALLQPGPGLAVLDHL